MRNAHHGVGRAVKTELMVAGVSGVFFGLVTAILGLFTSAGLAIFGLVMVGVGSVGVAIATHKYKCLACDQPLDRVATHFATRDAEYVAHALTAGSAQLLASLPGVSPAQEHL